MALKQNILFSERLESAYAGKIRLEELDKDDYDIMAFALDVIEKSYRKDEFISTTVGCALLTKDGRIYTGTNIEFQKSAPASICAETSAISKLVSDGGGEIEKIVAVYNGLNNHKNKILTPCGQCRFVISHFGNPYIILQANDKLNVGKTKLSNLYPLAEIENLEEKL